MSNKFMVDIETMGVHNWNSLILSVGLVEFEFEPQGPKFLRVKEWLIDLSQQLLMQRRVEAGTQSWWAEQSPKASDMWIGRKRQSVSDFKAEFETITNGATELWANGVCFDIGNLASLWDTPPWKYNIVRDARTVYRTIEPKRPEWNLKDESISHDPVVDCYAQVWELWRRLP